MPKPEVMVFDDLPRESLLNGTLTRTAVRSADSLVTINWITPDVPRLEPHHHPFDQLSMVFAGTMVLQIDGEEYEISPGSAILIPADAPHTAWVKGADTVLNVDVFAPAREDYLFLAQHQEG